MRTPPPPPGNRGAAGRVPTRAPDDEKRRAPRPGPDGSDANAWCPAWPRLQPGGPAARGPGWGVHPTTWDARRGPGGGSSAEPAVGRGIGAAERGTARSPQELTPPNREHPPGNLRLPSSRWPPFCGRRPQEPPTPPPHLPPRPLQATPARGPGTDTWRLPWPPQGPRGAGLPSGRRCPREAAVMVEVTFAEEAHTASVPAVTLLRRAHGERVGKPRGGHVLRGNSGRRGRKRGRKNEFSGGAAGGQRE